MKIYEPIKEYNENGVLVKEYIRGLIKINGVYYIGIPIDFIRANKLEKRKKVRFKITDRYDQIILSPLENEKKN